MKIILNEFSTISGLDINLTRNKQKRHQISTLPDKTSSTMFKPQPADSNAARYEACFSITHTCSHTKHVIKLTPINVMHMAWMCPHVIREFFYSTGAILAIYILPSMTHIALSRSQTWVTHVRVHHRDNCFNASEKSHLIDADVRDLELDSANKKQ